MKPILSGVQVGRAVLHLVGILWMLSTGPNPFFLEASQPPRRVLRALNTTFERGRQNEWKLEMESPGDVSALTFVVRFDPRVHRLALPVESAIVKGSGIGVGPVYNPATEPEGWVRVFFGLLADTIPGGKIELATIKFSPVAGSTASSTVVEVTDLVASGVDLTPLSFMPFENGTVTYTSPTPSLVITSQPLGGVSGGLMTTQPVISVRNGQGSIDVSSTAEVTARIQSGEGGELGGTTTVNAVSGVATFTNLTLSGVPGAGYVLRFTSPGMTPVDSQSLTVSRAIVAGGASVTTPSGGAIVPGNVVTITQNLTNNSPIAQTATLTATIPAGLSGVTCTSPVGNCSFSTGMARSGQLDIFRGALVVTSSSTQTLTWTGSIPGQSSVAISYQVMVSAQAASGTEYCILSAVDGGAGPTVCFTVASLPAGPGNTPVAGKMPNQQKPASILIFNVYTSTINTARSNTLISLTNTNPSQPITVHLFFVDGGTGSVADQTVTLTQNQTTSFLVSDIDPGITGYLLAIAVGPNGCPSVENFLLGTEVVRFESGHLAALPAIGVSALQGGTDCLAGSVTSSIAFDGVAYDELPRGVAVTSLPSIEGGNSSLLVVNRIGGNLTNRMEPLGGIAGLLFDDSEVARSFTLTGGACQLRGLLGNNFPRTSPRYSTVIPVGRTGWMKFWAVEDEAITGVMINEAFSGMSGGVTLPVLSTTNTATLRIPIISPK